MCHHQPSYYYFQIYLQIEDCRTRYNGDADHHQRRKKFTFPAHLICGDCFEVLANIIAALKTVILSLGSLGLTQSKKQPLGSSICGNAAMLFYAL